jgi:hypothetical protein
MPPIIRQQAWTQDQLQSLGFMQYERFKQLVMARRLPPSEAPKLIRTSWGDTLTAQAGYVICYTPGDVVRATLDEYEHWPVEPYIFRQTYRAWKDTDWHPTPTEAALYNLGCKPCYKQANVWAKPLTEDIFIQSLENPHPVRVEKGRVLAIGTQGEPYAMSMESFRERYYDPNAPQEESQEAGFKGIVSRLVSFLRGAAV